jgi:carboxypeptidase family protein/putative zinc finger protein
MSDLLQSGQHPDADQLSAFIEHALPAHEQEETLAHLAICPHCRSIVALSLPAIEVLPEAPPEAARRPWLSGWMMLPAGAALAALILAGIYIRSGFVTEKRVSPMPPVASTPPAPLRQLPPSMALNLEKPGGATHTTDKAPERSAQSQAADRLSAVPGGGGAVVVSGEPSTAQSPTVSVAAANQAFPTESPIVNGLLPSEARILRGLPSGLPALSTVTNARQVVAIDAHHTLFASNDGGEHWNAVPQPWQGRAVKVESVSASYLNKTVNRAEAAAPAGLLGGAVARDSAVGPKATLSGAIIDPAGASIPNVSVLVTNSVTQAVHRTKTDAAGRYTIGQLDPGNYTLQADAPGFTPQQVSGLTLTATQQTQTNLTLAVGSLAQSVEVQGEAKPVLSPPLVQKKIAVSAAEPRRFEITTDTGEHWTSIDGRSWQRKE